jgi:hypothetical protein
MIAPNHAEPFVIDPKVEELDPEIEELELHTVASVGDGTPTLIGIAAIYSVFMNM